MRTPGVARIFAGAGLLVIAVWAILAFYLHAQLRQTLEGAEAEGRNLALSIAAHQASSVRAIDLSLVSLREHWARDPGSFAAAVDRYEHSLKRERIIQVAVVDGDGWNVFSRLPQAERLNFADRDYFQRQKSSKVDALHISPPVLGRVTRQWAIQFTRALRDPAGRFSGLVIVAVPPPALELAFRSIDLGKDGVISLASSDGTILARTVDFEQGTKVGLAGGPGLDPGGPVSGFFRAVARIDGVERIVAYHRLEDYPLSVFVGQSVQTILAPYRTQRNLLLAAGALTTALIAALALLVAARVRDSRKHAEQQESLMLELHDGCIQSIYGIGLGLENSKRLIAEDPGKAIQSVAESQANLSLVIQELRAFIAGNAPVQLSEEAFTAELRRITPEPGEGRLRIEVDVDPAAVRALHEGAADHVLRIAREAFSNILRHSRAQSARLSLALHEDKVRLEVADDGGGMAEGAAAGAGLGLQHIRARARKLGGSADIASNPGQGTRILVEFPAGRAA